MSCSHDFKLFVMFLPGRENLFECQNVLLRHDSFALDEQFLTISIAIWRRQCGHESEHASLSLPLDFAKAGSRSIDQFQVCLSSPSRKALGIEEDACVSRFACRAARKTKVIRSLHRTISETKEILLTSHSVYK